MKIYLAGSIAGGRKFAKNIRSIAAVLEKLGHEVISPFVVSTQVNESRFPGLKGKKLAEAKFKEDLDLVLNKVEAIVAEVSQPSHGVGVELGAITAGRILTNIRTPILLLMDDSLKNKTKSSLIFGNPHATFKYYNKDNVERVLKNFFGNIRTTK